MSTLFDFLKDQPPPHAPISLSALQREVHDLVDRLIPIHRASLIGSEQHDALLKVLFTDIMEHARAVSNVEPPTVAMDAIIDLVGDCILAEPLLNGVPQQPTGLNYAELLEARMQLRNLEKFMADPDPILSHYTRAIGTLIGAVFHTLPSSASGLNFDASLLEMKTDVADTIDDIIGFIFETTEPLYKAGFLRQIYKHFEQRVRAIAGVTASDPDKLLQQKYKPARQRKDLTPREMVDTYFDGMPLLNLFDTPWPLTIPTNLFTEHGAIFAPSGHGKSQLLQTLVLRLLNTDDPPGMFIIDSQGDMLTKIERLNIFNPTDGRLRDRLIIMDPEDPEPPALNFFDIGDAAERGYDTSLNELFQYLFTAIDSDLTAKQATAVDYLIRLVAQIPDATIETLKDIMEEKTNDLHKSVYRDDILKLDKISQDFFRNQFFDKSAFGATKQQVARRLYTLLGNRLFVRMFAAKRNTFNALAAMTEKKIILINTSQKKLGTQSSVFGRYFIAQALSAAIRRGDDRHLSLLIVDEASEYFDDKTERILAQARKYGLGLLFATQNLEQMDSRVKAAVNGNTSIKLAGPVGHSDATQLAREMHATPEFIRSMSKSAASASFACHLRNHTQSAVRISIPFGLLEAAPKMDAASHTRLRHANRLLVHSAPDPTPPPSSSSAVPPTAPPTPPPTASASPDPMPSHDAGARDDMHTRPSGKFRRPPAQ